MSKRPIVAIMYDFDKTLSSRDMQEYSFIPSMGIESSEFWRQSDALARQHSMDHILSYMMLMLNKCREKGIKLTRQYLIEQGKDIELYKGVEEWFDLINEYGNSVGVDVKHYIISCGLKPMVEGCSIADKFANVFACEYVYGEDGEAIWPAVTLNYTSKTQFLFRINKGVEDVAEHKKVNMYTPQSERAVKYTNMIYIGDGLTDVPAMKMTRLRGGYSVGVYSQKKEAQYLIDEDRVDFYIKADYSKGGMLHKVVTSIIDKIASVEKLEFLNQKSIKEE